MRCTKELLTTHGTQTLNPCGSRTFTLRGCKIELIENLGALEDAFECLDFSENEIGELNGFPPMPHVKFLIVSQNKIRRIGSDVAEMLPNLESLVLTGNLITELDQLIELKGCKKLTRISLLSNPINTDPELEPFLINLIPSLKLLNFCKVKREKQEAAAAATPASSVAGQKI